MREPKTHDLKTWPVFYEAVNSEIKTFEIRFNDRDYQAGDTLHLMEYDPVMEEFTGRELYRNVPYILAGLPFLPAGYVCMSIEKVKQ